MTFAFSCILLSQLAHCLPWCLTFYSQTRKLWWLERGLELCVYTISTPGIHLLYLWVPVSRSSSSNWARGWASEWAKWGIWGWEWSHRWDTNEAWGFCSCLIRALNITWHYHIPNLASIALFKIFLHVFRCASQTKPLKAKRERPDG